MEINKNKEDKHYIKVIIKEKGDKKNIVQYIKYMPLYFIEIC